MYIFDSLCNDVMLVNIKHQVETATPLLSSVSADETVVVLQCAVSLPLTYGHRCHQYAHQASNICPGVITILIKTFAFSQSPRPEQEFISSLALF